MKIKEMGKIYWTAFAIIGIGNFVTLYVTNNLFAAVYSGSVGLIAVAYVLIKIGKKYGVE